MVMPWNQAGDPLQANEKRRLHVSPCVTTLRRAAWVGAVGY